MNHKPPFKRPVGASVESALRWLSFVAVEIVRAYRAILSPILFSVAGPACRFEPTCSAYAGEAIARHGIIRGSWVALKRLSRCRPLGGWGFDPVPETRYVNSMTITGFGARRAKRNSVGQ